MYGREEKVPLIRLAIVQYAILGIFLLLIYGLWRLQVLHSDYYAGLAEQNRVKEVPILAPRGRLHFLGVMGEPVAMPVFPMLAGQKSLSGSPLGSPVTTADMLAFAARHGVAPVTETFPMSKVNDDFAHLRAGKARYRIVLENDLKA